MIKKGQWDLLKTDLLKMRNEMDSGVFYYNLGTVYLLSNNLAVARYHFQKALTMGFVHTSVFNNLSLAKEGLRVEVETSGMSTVDQAIYVSKDLPDGTLAGATLLMVLLGLFVWAKGVRLVSVMFIALGLLIGGFYLSIQDQIAGIVIEDAVVLHGPSKIFSEVGKIRTGMKVIVEAPDQGWFKVLLPAKYQGWIEKEKIGLY